MTRSLHKCSDIYPIVSNVKFIYKKVVGFDILSELPHLTGPEREAMLSCFAPGQEGQHSWLVEKKDSTLLGISANVVKNRLCLIRKGPMRIKSKVAGDLLIFSHIGQGRNHQGKV